MEQKTVRIKIKTVISDLTAVNLIDKASDGNFDMSLIPEDDVIEYSADATLTDHGDRIELCYDEDESMGMRNTHTQIVFAKDEPDSINMKRTGDNAMSLFFSDKSRRQNCAYNAGGYTMEFCIYTRKTDNRLTVNGGTAEIDYTMEVCGTKTQRNHIYIKVDEIK